MQKKRSPSTVLFLLAFALVTAVVLWGQAPGLSAGVTQEGIRAVEIGMSQADVVALLGKPRSVETGPGNDPDRQVMNYSRRLLPLTSYPLLWVHLDQDRVMEVYGKITYRIGTPGEPDDKGVYSLTAAGHWQTAEFATMFPE